MKRFSSTIEDDGHVLLPTEIWEHLDLNQVDRVWFEIMDSGDVVLKRPTYPNLAALAGAAGTLDHPLDFEEMLEIARDDALSRKYRHDTSDH